MTQHRLAIEKTFKFRNNSTVKPGYVSEAAIARASFLNKKDPCWNPEMTCGSLGIPFTKYETSDERKKKCPTYTKSNSWFGTSGKETFSFSSIKSTSSEKISNWKQSLRQRTYIFSWEKSKLSTEWLIKPFLLVPNRKRCDYFFRLCGEKE